MSQLFCRRKGILLGTVFFLLSFLVLPWPQMVKAVDTLPPALKIFQAGKKGKNLKEQSSFLALTPQDVNGGTVAVCNLDNKGADEIMVGAGHGSKPEIKIYNRKGTLKTSFMALPDYMLVGLNVACGKLDGAKKPASIVVAAGRGGGPLVQVFDQNGHRRNSFFAYDQASRNGAFVAVGKVDRKTSGAQIITGSGPGARSDVRVFDKQGNYLGLDFLPFAPEYEGGVSVAVANVDGGKQAEIVMAQHVFGGQVKVYKNDAQKSILAEFNPYVDGFMGGINVANVGDVDKDGVEEFMTAPRQAGGPQIQIFKGWGAVVNNSLAAYQTDYRGGVSISAGNLDKDSKLEFVTLPQKKYAEGRTDLGAKYIEVNLATQTLSAYRNGVKEIEFLVSTGIARYPTPPGITQVMAKLPVHDYKWEYGPNHPDNYDIKNVHNNLRFRSNMYIHEAYWHSNFGHPMSHGCINVNLANSKLIYDWADVGNAVWVH